MTAAQAIGITLIAAAMIAVKVWFILKDRNQ